MGRHKPIIMLELQMNLQNISKSVVVALIKCRLKNSARKF